MGNPVLRAILFDNFPGIQNGTGNFRRPLPLRNGMGLWQNMLLGYSPNQQMEQQRVEVQNGMGTGQNMRCHCPPPQTNRTTCVERFRILRGFWQNDVL